MACVLAADTDKIMLAVVVSAEGRAPFFKLGSGEDARETEVNTIISNLYGLTGGQKCLNG